MNNSIINKSKIVNQCSIFDIKARLSGIPLSGLVRYYEICLNIGMKKIR